MRARLLLLRPLLRTRRLHGRLYLHPAGGTGDARVVQLSKPVSASIFYPPSARFAGSTPEIHRDLEMRYVEALERRWVYALTEHQDGRDHVKPWPYGWYYPEG